MKIIEYCNTYRTSSVLVVEFSGKSTNYWDTSLKSKQRHWSQWWKESSKTWRKEPAMQLQVQILYFSFSQFLSKKGYCLLNKSLSHCRAWRGNTCCKPSKICFPYRLVNTRWSNKSDQRFWSWKRLFLPIACLSLKIATVEDYSLKRIFPVLWVGYSALNHIILGLSKGRRDDLNTFCWEKTDSPRSSCSQ